MKTIKYLTPIMLLLLFAACDNNKKKPEAKKSKWNDSIVVYSQDDMYKILEGRIKVIDTACINEEKRAERDIKKGKVVYFFFNGMTDMYRSNRQLAEILLRYGIETDSALTSCILPLKGFRRNCYITVMNAEIERRHGKNFIDSVRTLAEKKYVLTHPNVIYKFEECDTVSRYAGSKTYAGSFEKSEIDFLKSFKYPEGYKFKKEQSYSYTSAYFILNKDGSISNLSVEADFQNPANKKYAAYFEERFKKFVENAKWIPATKAGVKVNSEMDETFTHK